MKVTFIAHAGFHIEEDGHSLMIDPWFFSSDFDQPVLRSILPKYKTIDYQLPEAENKIEEFTPNAILVSHFHTHHSPEREINQLFQQSKHSTVELYTPAIDHTSRQMILQNFRLENKELKLFSVEGKRSTWNVGPMQITGFYMAREHVAWWIQTKTGSFLHISDAMINLMVTDIRLGALWYQFKDLRPDMLAISCAGHCSSWPGDIPTIWENSSLSPVQAGQIADFIKPRIAVPIGVYNFSIWSQRTELSQPPGHIEFAFRWALKNLDSSVQVRVLSPGDEFLFEQSREIIPVSDKVSISGEQFFNSAPLKS